MAKQTIKMIGTREVAALYEVDIREVLYAARRGLLKGTKFGWVWMFNPKELPDKWPVRKRKVG